LKEYLNQDAKKAVLGVDAGSSYVKAVVMSFNREILATANVETGISYQETSVNVAGQSLEKANLTFEDVARVVSTGYGRRMVGFADEFITEISCHAAGTHWLYPQADLVIDIGGQDSKVIGLSNSQVTNFAMNDKCAAGTGRFLEVMSRALKVDLGEMGSLAARAVTPATISSVCTVFAESEVISLLASGRPREEIVAGILNSISQRVLGMVTRVGIKGSVVMTGGVARNTGMVHSLEKMLSRQILVPANPEFVGAIGACLFALGQTGNGS
jgi:predicted CoA-substrate-specific enzyme activase